MKSKLKRKILSENCKEIIGRKKRNIMENQRAFYEFHSSSREIKKMENFLFENSENVLLSDKTCQRKNSVLIKYSFTKSLQSPLTAERSPLFGSDLDQRSEAETHNTKISDSGYSTGCSNSQSQRSGSSKSIHSNSGSSHSSGYGGLPATAEEFPQPHSSKSSKGKDHKKKKSKAQEGMSGGENKNNDEKNDIKTNENSVGNSATNTPVSISNINNNNSVASSVNKGGNNNTSAGKILNISGINSTDAGNCETLHLATVAQTLKCIKKNRNDGELETNVESIEVDETTETPESVFTTLKIEPAGLVNGQFCLVVSMQDGKVLYTTPSLSDVLGFPCDMWIGRSFIDFVHHKDRVAFANHITVGVAGPMISNSLPSSGKTCKTSSNTFFCCLRKYRGLRTSGFGIKDKAVEYVPFKLSLSFKEVKGEISDTLLVITAAAVKTAYNRPDEMRDAPKFVTRHLANTFISHVDVEAVSYLGYLPQDMIGRSIFEFYHPEDLPLLKEIYESVLEVQGAPYRSKPYRFRTQNGGYVLLETEWSSFINPWSKKLEFAIGQHRLLKGPPNPDVFAPPLEHLQISDEAVKENKLIQEEIKRILNEPISRSSESAKQQVSKRCKDLATFMESLMDKITKSELGKVDDVQEEDESFSVSNQNNQLMSKNFIRCSNSSMMLKERDSVMLGEISPHHDYCDSKSSSETPPSYNQLNYNENLQRFFESKPRTLTASDENSDMKIHSPPDEEGKTSPEVAENSKCRSPVNGSGTCSGSGSGLSSASNCIIGTNSTETNTSKHQDHCEPVTVLTEAVLSRHNEDMEKVLIKRHRDLRMKDGKLNETRMKTVIEKLQDHCHGVKRSGSQSWEGDKISKHRHTEPSPQITLKKNLNGTNVRPELSIKTIAVDSSTPHIYQQGPSNVNLWPPFSVTTFNQSVTPHATYTTSNGGMPVAGMIPVYYIPTGGNPSLNASTSPYSQNNVNISGNEIAPHEHPGPPSPLLMGGNTFMHQVQFMNAFPVYPAMGFGTPSLMYSPLMMAPQVPPRPQTSKIESEKGPVNFQRPASQATSVKAEPGSAIGSMVLSECSKKEEKSADSPEIEDSLCFSQDEEKPKEISGATKDTGTGDESSYSSYSSFLKTDDSMRSSEETEPGFSRKGRWEKEEKSDMESRPVLKEPPWLEEINLTPELMFRYQINNREITNVLESDLEMLKTIDQPKLVDDQLQQLYIDLELEGLSTKLKLEEGVTTSSCSSGEELQGNTSQKQSRKKKKQHDYTQLVMIYEENMPLPSPSLTTVVTN